MSELNAKAESRTAVTQIASQPKLKPMAWNANATAQAKAAAVNVLPMKSMSVPLCFDGRTVLHVL